MLSLLVWASLIVLVVTSLGGITLTVVRAIEIVRAFKAFGRVVGACADRILNGAERMEQRFQNAAPAERLGRATTELGGSLDTAKVLLREIRRVRKSWVGVRALVPRK